MTRRAENFVSPGHTSDCGDSGGEMSIRRPSRIASTVLRHRLQVTLVSARPEYLVDLVDAGLELRVHRVEVRRHADARLRAVVHEDVARDELLADGLAVSDIDRDRAAALLGALGRRHAEALLAREFDEARGLAHRLAADRLRSDALDDLDA